METLQTVEFTPVRTLTVADRCDRCSAQAWVLIVLPSGGELQMCLHHHKKHKESYPIDTRFFEQLENFGT